METGYLFLLILTGFNAISVSATTSNTAYRIYKVSNACLDQELPMRLSNISLKLVSGTYLLKLNANVTENIDEDLKMVLVITRCRDKSAPDTCEEFHKLSLPRFCTFMKIRGPWMAYLNNMEPPLNCPIKKGYYRMSKSMTTSIKEVQRLKIAKGYFIRFHVKHYGMKSNRLLFCAVSEGQL